MRLHYDPRLKTNAGILRKAENLAEVLLWKELRAKKLGVQFLRQRPIGNYIVDFYCHSLNLALEIDGVSHDSKVQYNTERECTLESKGIHLLHFQNADVKLNLDGVLRVIREEILRLADSAPPLEKEE